MAETSAEQVAFGWAGEASTDTERRDEPRPSTPPPLRGGYARRERAQKKPPAAVFAALPPDNELWDVHAAAHRAEDGTLPVKRLAGWGVRFIPAELRAWVQDGGGSRR